MRVELFSGQEISLLEEMKSRVSVEHMRKYYVPSRETYERREGEIVCLYVHYILRKYVLPSHHIFEAITALINITATFPLRV